MPELKDLVQYALDKQPAKFKETFGDLLSQRVVDRVEELKAEISANMFGEAPEDDDEDDVDYDADSDDEDDVDYDADSDDEDDVDDDDDAFVDDIEISDEELNDLVNFDDEDEIVDDEDLDDEDMEEEVDFVDEDDESFPEEGPAVKEGLRNFVKKVGAHIRQGMENDIARADDSRAAKARDNENKAILKKHYGTSNPNKIYKMRSHAIKSGRGDF